LGRELNIGNEWLHTIASRTSRGVAAGIDEGIDERAARFSVRWGMNPPCASEAERVARNPGAIALRAFKSVKMQVGFNSPLRGNAESAGDRNASPA
jgi:hypothetical protein